MPTVEERITAAKDNAVLQAQIWAQEARTQRATVLEILRYFGCPENDWEAVNLIREKGTLLSAALAKALDALEHVTVSETFYRDPRGDCAGPAIDALRAALESTRGVMVNGLTEAETAATASVSGLVGVQEEFATVEEVYKLGSPYRRMKDGDGVIPSDGGQKA